MSLIARSLPADRPDSLSHPVSPPPSSFGGLNPAPQKPGFFFLNGTSNDNHRRCAGATADAVPIRATPSAPVRTHPNPVARTQALDPRANAAILAGFPSNGRCLQHTLDRTPFGCPTVIAHPVTDGATHKKRMRLRWALFNAGVLCEDGAVPDSSLAILQGH